MTHEAAEFAKLVERVEACRVGGEFALDVDIRSALGLPLTGSPKSYTASLDAAMSLIPETSEEHGERFRLEAYMTNGVLAEHVRASAWVPGAPRAYAATPALALCAAALRARAILSERSESE